MATWAGQNVGAKKLDGCGRRAEGQSYGLCLFGGGLCGAVFLRPVSGLLFVDSSETELIRQISTFLICNSMFYIPLTW